MTNGYGGGREVDERIFAASDGRRPLLYWDSGQSFESAVNFWTMQMAAGLQASKFDLRVYAYGSYDTTGVSDLCTIRGLIGGPIDVVSSRDLVPELEKSCPGTAASIHVSVG
jgi:hypothetical protein